MKDGLITLAAAAPKVCVADPRANADAILETIREADARGVAVLVLPELCLTGCTCGDLFFQQTLLCAAKESLLRIAAETANSPMLIFLGLPMEYRGKLYNCAAALCGGKVLGIVPKTCPSAAGESGESRYFVPAPAESGFVSLNDDTVPFGSRLLFSCREMPTLCVGCEIGTDASVPLPPSVGLCCAGASVIVHPSATAEIAGRAAARRTAVIARSRQLLCAYVSVESGDGESTTDFVFGGHALIGDGGTLTAENPPFGDATLTAAEADLFHLLGDRRRSDGYPSAPSNYTSVEFSLPIRETKLTVPPTAQPFLPSAPDEIAARCREILEMQSRALTKRLCAAHANGAVVAVSGGLDSCLALLVTAHAFDLLGRDRSEILTVTMPCFGTTGRTRSNAQILCEELGVSFREIPIADAVEVHFRDIGHDPANHDVVFENAQARERTQIIMDLANGSGALVVGTGDLSELALGWATYNGDHMSNYGVNAGIPKTLIRHIVAWCADAAAADGHTVLADVLRDILATPVSPELLPANDGEIAQKTEDIVGPYELHDFILYHLLRYGDSPAKIFRLACAAFAGTFDAKTVAHWLRVFLRRFFIQQFKRSCLPDGPKIGTVGVSPRGDWRMPSDAEMRIWMNEMDEIEKNT